MSADILPFAAPGTFPDPREGMAYPPLSARLALGRRVYALADMAARLGIVGANVTRRRVISTLRLLAAPARHGGADMPGPLTPRVRCGQVLRGPAAIGAGSLWDAPAVDAWLDRWNNDPGSPAAAPAPPLPLSAREEMARRAHAIGAGR